MQVLFYFHSRICFVAYRKTSIKRRVSNKHRVSVKRRGLLAIQSCQSTSHTLYAFPIIIADTEVLVLAKKTK